MLLTVDCKSKFNVFGYWQSTVNSKLNVFGYRQLTVNSKLNVFGYWQLTVNIKLNVFGYWQLTVNSKFNVLDYWRLTVNSHVLNCINIGAVMGENVPWHERPTKTQINFRTRAIWSDPSLPAWNLHDLLSKMPQAKILIRLRECAGWSKSSLGVYVRRYVFRRNGLFIYIKFYIK